MDAVVPQQPLERGPVIALRIGLAVGMAGDDLRSIVRCVGRRADRPVLLDQLAENAEEGLVDLLVARQLFERGLAWFWEEQAVAVAQDDAFGERALIVLEERELAQIAGGLIVVAVP